jgi:hypothetical protein
MEIVMPKYLVKHDNYKPSSGNPISQWLSFFRSCSDAWKSRKARRKHAKAIAALDDHMLYDIGEQDLRFCRSAWPALNPHRLLIDPVLNRDSVVFGPRR